jgi:Flp pilus assembly CpaF family ATPase
MSDSRDYLAHQLKTATIPLTDRQKEAVRLYLTRNPEVALVLNPFSRVPAADRDRLIRNALRQCVADGVVATAADPGEGHRYRTADDDQLLNTLYAQVVGLDVLETLLQDEEVSSITVVNQKTVLYEKGGQTYLLPGGFESQERMIEVVKNLAIRGGQQLTPAAPTADLAFPPPQVVRIHLSIDPVTPRSGAFMALRRGRAVAWTLDKLVSKGVMDEDVSGFIRALLKIPASIIVGGEPASGCLL